MHTLAQVLLTVAGLILAYVITRALMPSRKPKVKYIPPPPPPAEEFIRLQKHLWEMGATEAACEIDTTSKYEVVIRDPEELQRKLRRFLKEGPTPWEQRLIDRRREQWQNDLSARL